VLHEYIVVYTKNKNKAIESGLWRKKKEGAENVLLKYRELRQIFKDDHDRISKEISEWFKSLPKNAVERNHKHYRYSDDRGLYFAADFSGPNDGRKSRPRYDIIHPITGKSCKKPSTGWRWEEATTIEALNEIPPRIHFGKDETTIPCRKSYLHEVDSEPLMSVFYRDGRSASKLVDDLLGKGSFDFPKNPEVLQEWIGAITQNDDIILDSFAGSGTTAQAVLQLNKTENTSRKFILIELEDYADKKTALRVKKIINGYGNGNKKTEGTGGSFDYYELGQPLFIDEDVLNEEVEPEKIRQYVWFSETHKPYKAVNQTEEHLLGVSGENAYYFYYYKNRLTTLDDSFLRTLKTKAGQYIIYADLCVLDTAIMQKYHITFKKIPRDITRF
jgi:adenine-specific DNA-methyltransferase